MKIRILYQAFLLGLALSLLSCSKDIRNFQQFVNVENKHFRLGFTQDVHEVEDGFYPIRMDINFQSAEDYKSVFEGQNFNYVMNDIGLDFKFLNGKDTISSSGNFTIFNNASQRVSVICLFPKEIRKADKWMLRKNCFLTDNLIQKI